MAVQFLEEISNVPIQSQVKDNMIWLPEPNGQYTTRSAYSLCMNTSSVMDYAIYLAWSWIKAKDKDFSTSFNHWSSNISTLVA